MRSKRLPLGKRVACRLDSSINIYSGSLGNGRDLFSGSRVDRIEKCSFDRLAPVAINEVAKAPVMAIEPK